MLFLKNIRKRRKNLSSDYNYSLVFTSFIYFNHPFCSEAASPSRIRTIQEEPTNPHSLSLAIQPPSTTTLASTLPSSPQPDPNITQAHLAESLSKSLFLFFCWKAQECTFLLGMLYVVFASKPL